MVLIVVQLHDLAGYGWLEGAIVICVHRESAIEPLETWYHGVHRSEPTYMEDLAKLPCCV